MSSDVPTAHERWMLAHPHAPGLPAWLRQTPGEQRLPVLVTIAAAIALQVGVPTRYAIHPRWPLPAMEVVLLVVLFAANPVRLTRDHPALRVASLLLTAAITVGNAVSAALLVHNLVRVGGVADDAATLLGGGGSVYLTNIIAFGLWYWEFDRGGPFERARGRRVRPDFLFPQMSAPEVMNHIDWEPTLLDYLYVSFTNATAFSPTDTAPLSRWAKLLMAVQSAVALVTIGLVIARAVNVLG